MQKTVSGSFRLRLVALVAIGIIPPLLGAIWVASYRAARVFQAEAQQRMAVRADALGVRVDQWYRQNLSMLDDLRAEADFSSMEREAQLPTMLSALQARPTEVDALVTVDLNGEVVADVGSRPRTLHYNYRQQDWFQAAVSGEEGAAATIVQARPNDAPTAIFSKPILAQPALASGDRGDAVAQLQTRLQNLGYYSGPIDGIYAEATTEAVARFKQVFHRENSPGDRVDRLTWQAIGLAEQASLKVRAPLVAEISQAATRLDILQPASAEVEGVVMVEAQLDDIQQALNTLEDDSSGYALVIDDRGQLLAHSAQLTDTAVLPAILPAAQPSIRRTEPSQLSESMPGRRHPDGRPGPQAKASHSTNPFNSQPSLDRASGTMARAIERKRTSLQPASLQPASPPVGAAALTNLSQFPPVTALRRGDSGPLNFADRRGQHWIAHSETLASGWSVVLIQPSAAFSQEARVFGHLSLATGAIALLVTAIAVGILSAKLTRPLTRLSTAATALSHGHFDRKIDISGPGEIGTLAVAFNSVADQLQVSFAQLANQNETLKRLDRLKDRFLANTSHELKTPLNGMIGVAESLLDGAAGDLSEPQRQNVAMIADSAYRLTRLVNDLLDFSKLQHQQLILCPKPTGIRASVDVVLALCRAMAGSKPITLTNQIPADVPWVHADENRLQQILLNLIGNATKFTERGNVTVSAELVAGTPGRGTALAIAIRDTGPGIAGDRLEQIFQPFQQVEKSALSYGGTGLGLSITRHLVNLHGGKIWATSQLGRGSTFTFTLPLASALSTDSAESPVLLSGPAPAAETADEPVEVPSEAVSEEAEQPQRGLDQLRSLQRRSKLAAILAKAFGDRAATLPPQNAPKAAAKSSCDRHPSYAKAPRTSQAAPPSRLDPSKFNILVVDDEPINVQVLKNHLSLENYSVTHALSGMDALALIAGGQQRGQTFDLVVLDVMMPRMSGYEVCAKLREIYPAHELPVVMLTAKNQVSDLIAGFHFGANDYMTKPFSKDELLTRIKSHLRLSKTNHSYGRFVPSEYLRFLEKESILDVQLGDHVSKEMAVMFSDIRSFTTLSETMTPQENFDFVNAYLRQVSPVVRDLGGFIVKYLGDGMMAVFPGGVDDALAAGVGKLRSVAAYNQRRQTRGFAPIAVGIGIHFGHMMVGMVGESARMQGDAFSDNVNLTARLESLTKLYGVSMLISDRALACLSHPERYQIRFLDRAIVKGRSEPIDLYHVLDGEPAATIEKISQSQTDFSAGIACYQAGEFLLAQAHFQQVLQVHSEDGAARLYSDRLSQLIQNPPTDWQGVWKMARK